MNIEQVLPEKPEVRRATKYTKKLGEEITSLICDGEMLSEICQVPGMPTAQRVRRWVVMYETFRKQFEKARLMQADWLFEEAVAIGKRPTSSGKDRLRVETLLKAAAILKPKEYGDKKEIRDTVNVNIHSTLDLNSGKVVQSGPYVIEANPAPEDSTGREPN